MEKLNGMENTLIIDALKTEQRELNYLMQTLERQGFHNGNQNVAIQNKMINLNDLIRKLEDAISISIEPRFN